MADERNHANFDPLFTGYWAVQQDGASLGSEKGLVLTSRWACNPEVQRLLSEAKRLMDEGHVSEKEMERLLIVHLQVLISPNNPILPDM